jgi:uracil-DNA glycosylase family 4
MDKLKNLERVNRQILRCPYCNKRNAGKLVVGEGNAAAHVAFIGEAPGRQEIKSGRPFVGTSGKLLRKYIAAIGLNESQIYITSPVKYLPASGAPTPDDIAHGRKHLEQQLDAINPKVIVLLGRVAAEAVLGQKISVSLVHGKAIKKSDKTLFIMYHPAAGLHNPNLKETQKKDFLKLKRLLDS